MSTIQTTERYVVVGTNVHDREADRIARFENAGVAQIGADWLNTPDATPEDYQWTTAEEMTSAEWLSAHPEVIAVAPAWADTIEASDDGPDDQPVVSISFERDFGSLEIGAAAVWDRGTLTMSDNGQVYVYFNQNEKDVTAADLRRCAADFAAAADALDSAQHRSLRRATDVDSRLMDLDN